jgi:ketopantoate reductase
VSPDDAAAVRDTQYDYVFLSIKALPDVYDMAAVIESVVTPNHTCILVNTTHAVGLEATLEERFPSNIVLSLVCDAHLSQIGPSEFEHRGSTRIWVGPASKHPTMEAIQTDMAHALVLTLNAGSQMDCVVSPNIRQQQFEHVAGYVL